jgi:PAS domain S-box-containing protein
MVRAAAVWYRDYMSARSQSMTTTWRLFDRLRRGIGPRLLVRVLLFSVVSTLVLTLSQLYLDYRRDTAAINGRMSEIADSYGHSLGEGLWNLDRRQLELQIEGILRFPAVRFVEVRETTDRGAPMVVSGGARGDRPSVRHQFPLFRPARGEQHQLGVLTVEASFDDVYRALRDKAVVILTGQGATIFVVSLFVLYLTHRLVTRHLTALAGFLRHYDVLRPPPPLSLRRRPPTEKDELDDVVAAFESMRRTLEQAYANLRASEQVLRDYAETASDWFWATGAAHEFTYVSEQVRAFGFHESELLGRRRLDGAADVAAEPQKWREHMAILERHEPFRDFVFQRRRLDGTLQIVSASGKPVFDAEGRFTGYRGVARDITELRRAEEMLREREQRIRDAQLELARVTRVTTLGELVASIAHEINQPLAAIMMNTSAALRFMSRTPPAMDEANAALHRLLEDGQRAEQVIRGIRAMFGAEQGEMTELDPGELIRQVVAVADSEMERQHISARLDLRGALPRVMGDRVPLQQVFLNLIMNAIEAMAPVTDRARVLSVHSDMHDARDVLITIQDNGIGIDPGSSARIFDAFFTTKSSGMGMGLAICKSIVESHGGRLWASPARPHGCAFHVVLPAADGT